MSNLGEIKFFSPINNELYVFPSWLWTSVGYQNHPSKRFWVKMDLSSRSRPLLNDKIEFLILHFSNLKCISKINLKFVYFMQKNINKQIFIQHFILQKRFWLIHTQIKHFVQCQKNLTEAEQIEPFSFPLHRFPWKSKLEWLISDLTPKKFEKS